MNKFIFCILFILVKNLLAQELVPVRIQYDGGGDWYGNKTTWVNILDRVRGVLNISTSKREISLKISDPEFFAHPIAYISGHGNIHFSESEVPILRRYLTNGGFLFADDDFGMDKSFRREMKKVFPELDFVELTFTHPIYSSYYSFKNGLPKIHEHAGGAPRGLALIYEERIICFYSFNTDISDGCEDIEIHSDPVAVREQALKMALNVVYYALTY